MVIFTLLALVLSVLRVNGSTYSFRPYWELGNVEMFEPVGFHYTPFDETYRLYLRAHPTPFGLMTVSSPDLVQWSEPELVGLNGPLRPNMKPIASFLPANAQDDYEAHHFLVEDNTFIIAKDQPLCHGWDLNIELEIPNEEPVDWRLASFLQVSVGDWTWGGQAALMELVVHYIPEENVLKGYRVWPQNVFQDGVWTYKYEVAHKVIMFVPDSIPYHFDYLDQGQATFARFSSHPIHTSGAACSSIRCNKADYISFHVSGNGNETAPFYGIDPTIYVQQDFHYVGPLVMAQEAWHEDVVNRTNAVWALHFRGNDTMRTTYVDPVDNVEYVSGRVAMDGLGQDLSPPAMLWNPPTEEHVGLSISTDVIPLRPTNSIGFWFRQRMRDTVPVFVNETHEMVQSRFFAGIWTDFYRNLSCAYHSEKSFGVGHISDYGLNASGYYQDSPPHMMIWKSEHVDTWYTANYVPDFRSFCQDCLEKKFPSLSMAGPENYAVDNAACDVTTMGSKVALWDKGASSYSSVDTEWEKLDDINMDQCGYLQTFQTYDRGTELDLFPGVLVDDVDWERYMEFYIMPPYDPNGQPQTCGSMPPEWLECVESNDGC